jgi:ribonuclease HI
MPDKQNHLLEYCKTDRQREIVRAVEQASGNQTEASKFLGVDSSNVRHVMRTIKRNASKSGWSPEHDYTHPVPEGFVAKGVSTLYDKNGDVSAQWVKSSADEQKQREFQEAAFAALSQDLPKTAPIKLKADVDEQLCNVYTLTDLHIGMLAWEKETGAPWDLKEAQRVVTGSWQKAIEMSPKSKTCVISLLGDTLHFDGMEAVTPASGHILDTDSRFPKVVAAAVNLIRSIIKSALQNHEQVHLIIAEGNHDPASSVWLRTMFQALYEDETRLTVDDTAAPYYAYEHGDVMLGFHHGHKINGKNGANRLAMYFASTNAWQGKKHRYISTGHLHHENLTELPGCFIVQHATLSAKDAYASRGGYAGTRSMSSATYHKKYGKVGEVKITPEMIEN